MPNETSDTSFTGFFDGPRVPSLISYCASPGCGTGCPCRACRIEDGLLCGVCRDADAVSFDDDGTPSGLAICGACKAECDAEEGKGA
jgi:hypothetical protein